MEDGESQRRNLERKFGSEKFEKNGVSSFASRMTQGIFVGHHDGTGAVLCITKNGVVRGKNLDKTDTERCLGIDDLGRLVWHSVANCGSGIEVDQESHS